MKRGATASNSVDSLQRWFHAAIVHPGGVEVAAEDRRVKRLLPARARRLEDLLLPSSLMTARERLDVYASSYFLRLRDVMKSDFPGLAHALGDGGFDAAMREYVTRHPPDSFTLNRYGAGVEPFLARECTVKAVARRRPFLVELARLERAVEEVFHAPRRASVEAKRLKSIPVGRWNRALFVPIPAFRLLAFRWPVNRYLQAVYDEKSPEIPAREANWLVVYRKEWKSWRARLDRDPFELLTALSKRVTLGAALAKLLAKRRGRRRETLLASLGPWFQEWTAEGIFAEIRVR
jgi:putative DNA-binding protein